MKRGIWPAFFIIGASGILTVYALLQRGTFYAVVGALIMAASVIWLTGVNKPLPDSGEKPEESEPAAPADQRPLLRYLQFQINPHFLYNTLDTMRSYALLSDQKDIADMAENLALFFRYAISNRQLLVPVEDELRNIRHYLFIQKKRFGGRFETKIELESPELSNFYMPKLTIQPLVENAITHGLEKLRSGGMVIISISATERDLIVRVSDNGVGMTEQRLQALNDSLNGKAQQAGEQRSRGNGIAMVNIQARIRALFGDGYGLHFRSAEGVGTTAYAVLPQIDDLNRSRYEENAG